MAQIGQRQRQIDELPDLDLALQKTELVRRFPLFAGMDAEQQVQLANRLHTVYAAPGDVLLREDERPRRVWFIASGAVEVLRAGQKNLLGRGDMFGQLAVLTGQARKVRVTAVARCTLLTLDDAGFLALVRSNEAFASQAVAEAEKRGVKIDLAALSAPLARPERRFARLRTALGGWRRD